MPLGGVLLPQHPRGVVAPWNGSYLNLKHLHQAHPCSGSSSGFGSLIGCQNSSALLHVHKQREGEGNVVLFQGRFRAAGPCFGVATFFCTETAQLRGRGKWLVPLCVMKSPEQVKSDTEVVISSYSAEPSLHWLLSLSFARLKSFVCVYSEIPLFPWCRSCTLFALKVLTCSQLIACFSH